MLPTFSDDLYDRPDEKKMNASIVVRAVPLPIHSSCFVCKLSGIISKLMPKTMSGGEPFRVGKREATGLEQQTFQLRVSQVTGDPSLVQFVGTYINRRHACETVIGNTKSCRAA
jgi:hypothetical protein